jgi:hypothetical protein
MIDVLNTDKFFLGIMLLVLNLGSRYLVDEISTHEEEYRRNIVLRRIAIFAVCFVGTRDIVTSILLTAGFIIIATGISRRSREGMAVKDAGGASKADHPGYDTHAPLLFTSIA